MHGAQVLPGVQLLGVLPALALSCHLGLRELPCPRTLTPSWGRPHPTSGPRGASRTGCPTSTAATLKVLWAVELPEGWRSPLLRLCSAPQLLPPPNPSSFPLLPHLLNFPHASICLRVCFLGNAIATIPYRCPWRILSQEEQTVVWPQVRPSTYAGNLTGNKHW